jgi:death on curing protein
MRYVTLGEVVELHRRLLQATGGAPGIRDFGALESAVAQPKTTFGGSDLYPTLAEKAEPPRVSRRARYVRTAVPTGAA